MKTVVCVEARPFAAFSSVQMDRLLAREDLDVRDRRGLTVDNPALREALREAEVIISGNDLRITAELLPEMPKLKLVAKLGVGLDMIDLGAAARHGVMVCNTPGANDVAVAEHTFALLLGHLRQVVRCDQGMRKGLWEETGIMGHELAGKTMGIVGMGAIGRCVARRALGFDMRVVACDPFWPEDFAAQYGIRRMELPELMGEADIVSVHCPLTESTRNCIAAPQLSLMRPSALLVNMARGGVVNEEDLYLCLNRKGIAGAVLDVYAEEPPVALPFVDLPNVTLSPHVGAFTVDAMEKMGKGAVDQVFAYLQGEKPVHVRN